MDLVIKLVPKHGYAIFHEGNKVSHYSQSKDRMIRNLERNRHAYEQVALEFKNEEVEND